MAELYYNAKVYVEKGHYEQAVLVEAGDQGAAAAIHPGGVSRGIGQQGIAAAYTANDAVLNQNCLLIMTLFHIDLGIIIQLSHY